MAAILCKPIGAFFECLCTAPCKACSGLSCSNPLSSFVVTTVLVQLPVVVLSAMELGGLGSCRASRWLLGMLVAGLSHLAAGFYLAARTGNATDEALRHRHRATERIGYLLCHDPWIAAYLLVAIFYFSWLCVGSSRSINGYFAEDYGSAGGCGSDARDRVSAVLGLGWFYLFAGPTVLSCTVCCASCCDKKDYAADDEAFAAAEAGRQSTKRPSKPSSEGTPGTGAPPDTGPPRTYSAEGIPIDRKDDDDDESEVVQAEAVVEGEVLPPPVMPPQSKKDDAAAAPKTGTPPAAKTKRWFGRGRGKKDGEKDPGVPDAKATVY